MIVQPDRCLVCKYLNRPIHPDDPLCQQHFDTLMDTEEPDDLDLYAVDKELHQMGLCVDCPWCDEQEEQAA